MLSSKVKISFAITVAVIVGLCFFMYRHTDQFKITPLEKTAPFNNLSRIAVDQSGNSYLISSAKQEIVSIDTAGEIRYQIKAQPSSAGSQAIYSDLAVDDQGRLYALQTLLDEFGLYVQSEKIVRFTSEGQEEAVLFEWGSDGQHKRVGQIKSLDITGEKLSFYINRNDALERKTMSLTAAIPTAEEEFRLVLPSDRYVSEPGGNMLGSVYYTTKRGGIYHVDADGTSRIVYPFEGSERTRKNFPEQLLVDAGGSLHFVDRSLNAITRMQVDLTNRLDVVIDEASMSAYAPGADSYEVIDFAITADGQYLIALADRILRYDTNGTFISAMTESTYSKEETALRLLVWGSALLSALALILLLILIYLYIMKRRFSFFLKQSAAFVPMIVISMVLLSNSIYDSFSTRLEEEMKRELSLLAQSGKHIIEGDRLERLTTPNDYMNEDYQVIKERMNFLFEDENSSDRRGLYSTLYKYEQGELFIIADDDDGVNMFKPFALNEENQLVLDQGRVIADSWEDSNGSWTYAIAPVYNSQGQVVGIYETGRDMTVLAQDNEKIYSNIIQNIVVMTAAIVLVFLITTYYLMSSLRKLRKSVMDIANGNWDVEVKLKNRDEVGDLGDQFNIMARHIRQYIKDITSFSEASFRFVPQQFFKYLGKRGILDIHLGDQVQQNMVVMVSKIRAFEQMSKRLTPKENFNFMNSFLSRFGPLIRQENGLISNYLGAGFMTLFPSRAEEALKAAIAIRKQLVVYNQHRNKVGYQSVDIGIGIHKGPLMLGIIGEESRMEGNVISDDVNLTSILESMSENLGASILTTRTVIDSLRFPELFKFRTLGRVRVEGKGEAIELFDVYDGDPDVQHAGKEKTKLLFERGVMLYQEGRFFDAREAFIEVIKLNRLDKAAKLYFYLCDEYYQRGTSSDWNGTLAVS